MAALVRIAAKLRAILATHVSFKLVHGCGLRTPHDVQRHGLMRIAAETFDFEIQISGVKRVTERGRWLGRAFEAEHALVPSLAGEAISFLACGRRALG